MSRDDRMTNSLQGFCQEQKENNCRPCPLSQNAELSGSECGGAENGPPDHHRMEHEAEREIKDDADDHGGDVVPKSAFGNRQPPWIAAVFEGDAVLSRSFHAPHRRLSTKNRLRRLGGAWARQVASS